jgi:hypothetical protein
MNGRNTSDVHTCVAKWSISWDETFCSEVNHKIVVKLNTGCVQNVVTTRGGGLGRPRLGTDAEDFVFQEPVTLTPTWMRSMPLNKTVPGGSKWYEGLVQPRTVSFRGTDFLVLSATASYCDVARYGLAKRYCVIKYDWMHDTACCFGYPSDSSRTARKRAGALGWAGPATGRTRRGMRALACNRSR